MNPSQSQVQSLDGDSESSDPAGKAQTVTARVERESGQSAATAPLDVWMRATAHEARADLAERMNHTLSADRDAKAKRVHYLSMEFLMGRALGNAIDALEPSAGGEAHPSEVAIQGRRAAANTTIPLFFAALISEHRAAASLPCR